MLLALLLGIIPQTETTTEHVAEIEVNRYYDGDGRMILTQLIFRDSWRRIIDWRLAKTLPRNNRVTWNDCERLYSVTADKVTESWSQEDPELEERAILPKEFRAGLFGRPPR